jgi:ABC-type arginine transport system permease subunit
MKKRGVDHEIHQSKHYGSQKFFWAISVAAVFLTVATVISQEFDVLNIQIHFFRDTKVFH